MRRTLEVDVTITATLELDDDDTIESLKDDYEYLEELTVEAINRAGGWHFTGYGKIVELSDDVEICEE